jgi:16S rRNA (adenine1518-N6/adenine1519-N6)-dimethyltransferase
MKHRARKRFGQNFLTDAAVIARIIAAISPREDDVIIEIGPGQAALTRHLVNAGACVHAVELDRDLAGRLADELGQPKNLVVHACDALEANLATLAEAPCYRLVGNLPYNISTPILFHILGQKPLPKDIHVMLQREVVERIVAEPGGKTYGRLSVMVQNRCLATPLFDIPPESFDPRPSVDSTLLRLQPRSEPLASADPQALDQVVRAAFAKRRKTLRNSLAGLLEAEAIQAAGIDPGQRAEQLEIAQFDALAQRLGES